MTYNMSQVTFASPETFMRKVRTYPVWGTVLVAEIRGHDLDPDRVSAAFDDVGVFFDQVDDWFSPYKASSVLMLIRSGALHVPAAPAPVPDVLKTCEMLRDATRGLFDPWAAPNGLDTSGFVKGWAADVAANMLVLAGFDNVLVNAAGDLAARGCASPNAGWPVGVQHPSDPSAVVAVVDLHDEAMATSGLYVHADHIIDPRTATPATVCVSATVVGEDGGVCEALATAFVVGGKDALPMLVNFPNYSGFLVFGTEAVSFGSHFVAKSAADVSSSEVV